jgi:hypothetical protein
VCFTGWFETVALPYCRGLPGKKVLIDDNLSSHFSRHVIEKCVEAGIAFVCLSPNSIPIFKPLDVSTFAPTKKYWRKILIYWKLHEGGRLVAIPKEWFPRLLTRLLDAMKPTLKDNIVSGFRKFGIIPLNKSAVSYRINRTPAEALEESFRTSSAITTVVLEKLNEIQQSLKIPAAKKRKKRLNVILGKSISLADFEASQSSSSNSSSDNESVNEPEGEEYDDDESEIPMPPQLPYPKKKIAKTSTSEKVSLPLKLRLSWDNPNSNEKEKTTSLGKKADLVVIFPCPLALPCNCNYCRICLC